MIRVGVTGGIGSGKSVVCQIFSMLGIAVYNSDYEAKQIMNLDPEVISAITDLFGTKAYCDGNLNRKMIADSVFSDASLLTKLNAIVHPAVARHFALWAEQQTTTYVIQESAILYESNADKAVDLIITVTAPLELKIKRACRRDNVSEADVRRRVANQLSDDVLKNRADYTINSDDHELVIPQILKINSSICQIASCK